jgi:hypothetical protein
MGKVIKLTESELVKIVQQTINEAQSDSNISAIQTALKNAGFGNLLGTTGPNQDGVDGIYGRNTKRAIRAYQKANGIKPTGFVGPLTAPKLGVDPMGKRKIPKIDDKINKSVWDILKGGDKNKVDNTQDKNQVKPINPNVSDTVLSQNISPKFKEIIPINKISSKDSIPLMAAGQQECARFVHDFSTKLKSVGNAWTARDTTEVGTLVWDSFSNLSPDVIKKIVDLWNKINNAKGGVENGQFNNEVRKLENTIVPKVPNVKLQLDDVVGLFYPPSGHHEEAYMASSKYGKGYFVDLNGKKVPGQTLNGGKSFAMNTHVGIVAAIKNGVPIIFHNIHGQVYSDPYNNLHDGSRICWVKRK